MFTCSSRLHRTLSHTVILGKGESAELRPFAYNTLADLIHHAREELTIPQLSEVVYIFARNIHDPSLPFHIQTAAVRLILNLVDHIYKTPYEDQGRGRMLLLRILNTLVDKFKSLKEIIPGLIEKALEKEKLLNESNDMWTLTNHTRPRENRPEATIKEIKMLM